MADVSGPFDGTSWAETEWYRHMPAAMKSGVIGIKVSGVANGALGFTASGRDVTLTVGNANVGGAGFSRTAPATSVAVPANTNASLSRRDRIVLRRSLSTHDVVPTIITGTAAASPVAPAITQNATTFDLKMFSFLVPPNSGTTLTSIIDERTWVSDGVADEAIFTPYLGEGTGTSGTASDTPTTIASFSCDIPESLDSVRRIRVHGYAHVVTAAGIGATIRLTSSDGWAVNRSPNVGDQNCDMVITRYDTDLTSGPRTYNLQVDKTVSAGADLTWRAAYLSAEII